MWRTLYQATQIITRIEKHKSDKLLTDDHQLKVETKRFITNVDRINFSTKNSS